MEYLATFVCGTVFTIICIVVTFAITIYPKLRKKKVKSLTALDVIRIIKRSKPFPVGPSGTWKLFGHTAEHRIWATTLTGEPLSQPIDVFSCFSKVKGSPQYILSSLRDVSKYPEWLPGIQKVEQVVGCPELEPTPKIKGPGPPPIYHDVIRVTLTSSPSSLIGLVNRVAVKIQSMPLIDKVKTKHRYWVREESNCCWMLEICEEDQDWCFYLIQPVEGFFGDTCLITLIVYEPSGSNERDHLIAALRLGALSNYLTYKKVQVAPLTTITLPIAVITSGISNDIPVKNNNSSSIPAGLDDVDKLQDEEIKNEPSFINKVRKLIEERKELYEEKKRLKPSGSSTRLNDSPCEPQSPKVNVASSILQHSQSSVVRQGSVPTSSYEPSYDEYDDITYEDYVTDVQSDSTSAENGETCPDDVREEGNKMASTKIERKSILTFLRSHGMQEEEQRREGGKDSDSDGNQKGTEDSPSAGVSRNEVHAFGQRLLKRIRSRDEVHPVPRRPRISSQISKNSSTEEDDLRGEVDSGAEDTEADIEEYRAIAQSVAADLLREKAQISRLDITRPYDEQAQHSAGWIYCGLEKDVVILRKIYNDGTPHQCYLGKGLICAPPKAVFEALKNPQTRFTYDEMLKKAEVLEDFDNGLSIVYLYHEVSQLFRKDARDFCVLQCEQIDGVKYIITYRSVVYNGCPEKQDVIRAKFLPSGWIIEPVTKDEKLYSMVTYIVQMELGMNKTNTGYLVEELAAKQPLSIAHLRQFLVPTGSSRSGGATSMKRSASVGQLRPKPPSHPTGASMLALAAMSTRDPTTADLSDSSNISSNRSASEVISLLNEGKIVR